MLDLNATLEELDGEDWGTPPYDSALVKSCHRLRRVPLKDFSIEDLRIMIGQEIGLKYLMPIALVALEKEPLAEGDFYPGDLLKNVLGVSREFWRHHSELKERMDAIVEKAKAKLETLDESDEVTARLKADLDSFD
jgi:contact-dependent growth inhibition (CDI) system CdiI-like immunity protein